MRMVEAHYSIGLVGLLMIAPIPISASYIWRLLYGTNIFLLRSFDSLFFPGPLRGKGIFLFIENIQSIWSWSDSINSKCNLYPNQFSHQLIVIITSLPWKICFDDNFDICSTNSDYHLLAWSVGWEGFQCLESKRRHWRLGKRGADTWSVIMIMAVKNKDDHYMDTDHNYGGKE